MFQIYNTGDFPKPHNNTNEDSATFHPDTILVNYEKFFKNEGLVLHTNDVNISDKNLISLEKALQLTQKKYKPVTSSNSVVNVSNPSKYHKNPPHGHGGKDGSINLESRKLFIRPKNLNTESFDRLAAMKNQSSSNKVVKKDLSKFVSH